MKQIYPFATILLTVILLSGTLSAQTYSGGTYTAMRSGNWSGNIWDANPSSNCSGCKIIINSGVTVTLDAHVTLSNSSLLQIGSDPNGAATELIISTSNGADWTTAFNVILANDGSSPANSIQFANSNASVNATGTTTASPYDGVLTSFVSSGVTSYFKQVGSAPSGFTGTAIGSSAPASYGTSLSGPVTLSAIGTLPIILSDFNAVLNENQVNLTWTTSLEENSDHFAVERSTDGGSHWTTVGTVAAQGNSVVTVNYSYTDANPASGVSEYRLQLVDKDGKYDYSNIEVIRAVVTSTIKIFPNPAKDFAYITFGGEPTTGDLTIRLLSQSGQLLTEKKLSNAGGTTVALSVSNYPQGNYLIQTISSDGTQQINKLLISK